MRHVSVSPVKLTLNKQHEQGTKKKSLPVEWRDFGIPDTAVEPS